VLERAIRIVSPRWAFKREMARFGMNFMASGGYRGARSGRHHDQWFPGGGSADQDLLNDLPTLRNRSRDLNRNDGIAAGATNAVVANVVGSGIMPQSQLNADRLGISQDEVVDLQNQAEIAWSNWKRNADSTNRLDFDDIQALVQRQILENGEILLIPLMIDGRRPYSLAFELVEADRLKTPTGKLNNGSIHSGIELGSRGQPLAYWIKKSHPGSWSYGSYKTDDYQRIKAWNAVGRANVLHLFHQTRPGQSRGVPWFAPALDIFKDMAEYLESEMVAARVAACYALLITSSNPYNMATQASDGETDASGKPVEYMEPGIIKYLSSGEDVKAFAPNRPGNTFDPFVERILRAIGVALDLPYEILAKDFSKTNYSSARASLLEARKFFHVRQIWLARKLCQPAWEMVLEEAWLRGDFKAKDFLRHKREYTKARWIPNGWQWVDPVKEANGSAISLKHNMTTLSSILAGKGEDLDETLETRAREIKKIQDLEKKYSITFQQEKQAEV